MKNSPTKGAAWALLAAIILAAAVARSIYATGLPLNWDEHRHFKLAQEISVGGDYRYLPLSSPATNHALGVVYVTAFANWIGGGNELVLRLTFVAMSLFGLLGLYLLGVETFGRKAALVAVALAALDRHLTASSPIPLESRVAS